MTRTQIRIVLILLALILVAVTILAGLLTWWASSAESQQPLTVDGETVGLLPTGRGTPGDAASEAMGKFCRG